MSAVPTAERAAGPAAAPIVGPAADSRPVLPRGVRIHRDAVRGRWVLLAPERALRLDDTGLAVLREVDGRRSLDEIAAALADRYGAPKDQVLGDATRFVAALWARRMLDLAP
jgi:pyrroloquinoline quinone biosynthesis protein D